MKLAVISSNGQAGQWIVKEALSRGIEVIGFARGAENLSGATEYVQKDLFDLTIDDFSGVDVVVDAFGTFAPETLHLHEEVIEHLASVLENTEIRLLVVGGAGSLYVSPEHDVQLFETESFPADYYPLAKAQAGALDRLREKTAVKWTFVSPAADFQVDGERTGDYILAGEEFTVNSKGESVISYADYAIAMLDEAEQGKHVQERISVLGK